MASWFETRGVAALLTMRVQDLILRSGVSRVSKDAASELKKAGEPTGSSRSGAVRRDQRDQLLAVMLELLVADTGNVAELVERRGARRGDAVDG